MIVEQPDGQYAVYSTITDSFLLEDALKSEVKAFELERMKERFHDEFERRWGRVEDWGTSGRYDYEDIIQLHNGDGSDRSSESEGM